MVNGKWLVINYLIIAKILRFAQNDSHSLYFFCIVIILLSMDEFFEVVNLMEVACHHLQGLSFLYVG